MRGEVVPVFDPRRRMGLPPPSEGHGSRVVVCHAGVGPVALLVDAISQVLRLPLSRIEPRPHGVGAPGGDYLAGIGREGDRLVVLLDAGALLAPVFEPSAEEPA